jgi:phosphatidylglycerophosphatase A
MNPNTEPSPDAAPPRKKPRLAYAIATALGVGYIPKAPGTFGSLIGVGLVTLFVALGSRIVVFVDSGAVPGFRNQPNLFVIYILLQALGLLLVGTIGVRTASRVAAFAGVEDPQYVVIDEVAGQQLTLLLPLIAIAVPSHVVHGPELTAYSIYLALSLLNWKYLLLGFILFRVFDIWKPFPVRQLEKLPGGWGIMADDWMAAIYAAICLRLALQFGLV